MGALSINISLGWVIFLAIGWLFVLIFIVFLAFLLKLTPAMTFLKASLGRKAVVFLKSRGAMGKFVLGRPTNYGTVNIQDYGPIRLTEDSRITEYKSKAAVYTCFSEFGATLPQDYEAIIQTMRKEGLKVNNFLDYEHYHMLATHKQYQEDYVNQFKNEELKKEAQELIKKVKELKIKVYPIKVYNISDLGNMFPYNINPVFIEGAIIEEVNKKMRAMNVSRTMWITIAIVIMLILIGVGFGYKMLTGGQQEVIIKTIQTGVETVKTNMTGLSM
jgi:hypothetical protein